MAVLSRKTLASYSGISAPMAAMGMPIAVYLPAFYAETMSIDLATVGLVFTLVRIWDFATDPIMGLAIDRFDTRWGRRKHWIAISVPILMLSVWMVFLPSAESASPLYLGFWMVLLYVGYTMMAIAHQSWGAELATTYDERSRLFGWREIFIIGGMGTVLAIPVGVDYFGSGSQADKVASMGIFCLILFPITLIPMLMNVPDSAAQKTIPIDWREALRVVRSNRTLWRLLAADFFSGLGTAVSAALYIFLAAYVFELRGQASIALLFYFVVSFLAMPLWLKLAYRVGKDTALKIAVVYGCVVCLGLIPLAEPGNWVVLWGFTMFFGFAYGAAPTLLRSMMADLTDVDELEYGQKRAGLFYAYLTTTNKMGAAIGVGLSFAILELVFAFVPGAENSQASIDGLLYTYCLGTAAGLFLTYVALIKYPLGRLEHDEIRKALMEKGAEQPI